MKIKINQNMKFAKSCRETLIFKRDQIVDAQEVGLDAAQVEYILKVKKAEKVTGTLVEPKKEIKLEKAVVVTEKLQDEIVKVEEVKEPIVEEVKEEVKEESVTKSFDALAHYKMEDAAKVREYAMETFGLDIDGRKSLKNMRVAIDEHIKTI